MFNEDVGEFAGFDYTPTNLSNVLANESTPLHEKTHIHQGSCSSIYKTGRRCEGASEVFASGQEESVNGLNRALSILFGQMNQAL